MVGRDAELAVIEKWLDRQRPALLEIEGEAGIGKTTLWEEATRRAREAGARVLECRPVEIETVVSYGALASLIEPALATVDGPVPAPRLRALEGAFRLRDVSSSSLDETAVALGALSVVRAIAEQQPVVLAMEDVQWLDASSRVVLTYALRNLHLGADVAIVLTRRLDGRSGSLDLAGSAVAGATQTLRLGPLSLGALHRLTHARLGTPLSRPKLVRVHSVSSGNPLHALELARVIADAAPDDVALAVPTSLVDTLRKRIQALSPASRSLLLVVAAAGDPTLDLVRRATDADEAGGPLDEAVAGGVIVVTDGRVRFSHPLLASTVYGDAGDLARSRIHLRLAELAETAEERARHLALAGTGPDETVALALDQAAEHACRRGARGTGAVLYEQAAGLTPPEEDEARGSRLVAAAHAHFAAGEPDRARTLFEQLSTGEGRVRFEALCGLGTLLEETVGGTASFAAFEAALGADDPVVAARAHRGLAQALAHAGSLEDALEHASAAVRIAEQRQDRLSTMYGLAIQSLVHMLSGHTAWREPLERALGLESTLDVPDLDLCPTEVKADIGRLTLEIAEARVALEALLSRATEYGDVHTECWCRFGLASVEITAGAWDRAGEHADELSNLAEQARILRLPAARTSAHLALLRGHVEPARLLLGEVVRESEPKGDLLNLRIALQLEGLLELSLGEYQAAVGPLRRARLIAGRMALGEPAMLMFLLDEVEALAATGDPASAAAVLREFEGRCQGRDSAWIAPLVARARGLVLAAEGEVDAARVSLQAAVALEERLPLPVERARTRLALGRILRRAQRRAAARGVLADALALFEELGALLWAERAREELARIGGRAPASDDLTPTERRIAELVADGMTNREAAAKLFVTPKTVESALTRVYRKLGVRSRTELARHFTKRG